MASCRSISRLVGMHTDTTFFVTGGLFLMITLHARAACHAVRFDRFILFRCRSERRVANALLGASSPELLRSFLSSADRSPMPTHLVLFVSHARPVPSGQCASVPARIRSILASPQLHATPRICSVAVPNHSLPTLAKHYLSRIATKPCQRTALLLTAEPLPRASLPYLLFPSVAARNHPLLCVSLLCSPIPARLLSWRRHCSALLFTLLHRRSCHIPSIASHCALYNASAQPCYPRIAYAHRLSAKQFAASAYLSPPFFSDAAHFITAAVLNRDAGSCVDKSTCAHVDRRPSNRRSCTDRPCSGSASQTPHACA